MIIVTSQTSTHYSCSLVFIIDRLRVWCVVIGSCLIRRRVEQHNTFTTTTTLIPSCKGLSGKIWSQYRNARSPSKTIQGTLYANIHISFFFLLMVIMYLFERENHPLTQLTFVTHTAMQYTGIFICVPWTVFEGDSHLFVYFTETLFYLWTITYMWSSRFCSIVFNNTPLLWHTCDWTNGSEEETEGIRLR